MNLKQTVEKILGREVSIEEAKRFANEQYGFLCEFNRNWEQKVNSKIINIVYGEVLIKHLNNQDWDLAVECIKVYNGDIISYNPQNNNIEELFQHIRGTSDFREITQTELDEINKRIKINI